MLVLAASGPLITARLVIGSDDQHASITALVRYEHATAPAVWAGVGIAHRAIAPMLLNAARNR